MGFFGNLWDGIKSAGQWAIQNSASITPVLEAVGKAAASVILADENISHEFAEYTLAARAGASDQQKLTTFPADFQYVSDQLAARAKKEVKAQVAAAPKIQGKTTTTDDGVVGLFRDPNGLSYNNKPSTSMYQDLSAFMGTMNIPFSWKDSAGTIHDAVNDIGQILFANNGQQALALLAAEDDPVVSVHASAPTKNGMVHAVHAYYPIPMGKGGKDHSLHSAIHISYTTAEEKAVSAAASSHLQIIEPLNDTDSWLVTIVITWASAPIAVDADIQKRFRDNLAKDKSNLHLVTSDVKGTQQTIKVQTPVDQTPAYAKATVQAAATEAVNDPGKDDKEPPKNSVLTLVTDSSWLPKGSLPSK